MNKKNTLILVGSLVCVALLGYFTYSTFSILMKDKATSQKVSSNNPTDYDEADDVDTSSENKDKNQDSQNDLSERLKETDPKQKENDSYTNEKQSEKTSNNSEEKSTEEKSNKSKTNENSEKTSNENSNSKKPVDNNNKGTKTDDSKSESKKTLSYSSYLNDLETEKYTLKENESLSDVAKKFKETCTVNSSLNIIKSLNQVSNVSSLESGDTLLVPVNAFEDGKKYTVKEGDTWYNIARKYYPTYNHEVVIDFLMNVNPFHNDILPLGEEVFLPNI
ncbi:LysM peptidoglycan-binding domain-containing protein [Clostridium sp. LIBA-8841]|uniref:LysM peptidoglycan-binding domain-containing protein n=1 Tax=Clostridium sp. LIBA-8841 TaxID=2987530 RepID=UPI002AC6D542|nr:LysM peptidoglycan-binding domain-containing protein [Clostridium sp. LIBA-8841]MDZ5253873.1 LysM peptidoglycan-binding domain-containing protein [Clostridium sp. LIBA-8841]